MTGGSKTNSVAHHKTHGAKITLIRAAPACQQRELPAADIYIPGIKPFACIIRRIFFKLKILITGHRERVKVLDIGFFWYMFNRAVDSDNNAV
jgi:hypothetical protein